MYANDHNGSAPEGYSHGKHNNWVKALIPLLQNKKALLCPVASQPALPDGAQQRYPGPPGMQFVGTKNRAWGEVPSGVEGWLPAGVSSSYGFNVAIYNAPKDFTNLDGSPPEAYWRNVNVKRGSEIPVFGDCKWIGNFVTDKDSPPKFEDARYWSLGDFCINRHGGNIMMSFLDGSGRKVGLKELWRLKWTREFDTTLPPPNWYPWMEGFKEY
jgi:prepilin-type processing-associated H-X9-DG protein